MTYFYSTCVLSHMFVFPAPSSGISWTSCRSSPFSFISCTRRPRQGYIWQAWVGSGVGESASWRKPRYMSKPLASGASRDPQRYYLDDTGRLWKEVHIQLQIQALNMSWALGFVRCSWTFLIIKIECVCLGFIRVKEFVGENKCPKSKKQELWLFQAGWVWHTPIREGLALYLFFLLLFVLSTQERVSYLVPLWPPRFYLGFWSCVSKKLSQTQWTGLHIYGMSIEGYRRNYKDCCLPIGRGA